jgi:hypothetical protein
MLLMFQFRQFSIGFVVGIVREGASRETSEEQRLRALIREQSKSVN